MPFELTTKSMTMRERDAWFRREGQRQYDKFSGKPVDDLGPEIRLPKGKLRCHGIRKRQVAHGNWEDDCADAWYRQSSLRVSV